MNRLDLFYYCKFDPVPHTYKSVPPPKAHLVECDREQKNKQKITLAKFCLGLSLSGIRFQSCT